jgi:predicted metal-binding membrane protein
MPPSETGKTFAAVWATFGLAAAAWALVVWQTREFNDMDTGMTNMPVSFISFIALWVPMMAAMMLPSIALAVLRSVHVSGRLWTALQFVLSYLAVWTLVGVVMYPLRRPLGPFVSGLLVIGAGMYELTPVKQFFRRRCYGKARSGFEFGLDCVGSCIALMIMQFALGFMSLTWMAVICILVVAQKLLPPKVAIDVSLALVIIVMGFLIVVAPYRHSLISQIQGQGLLEY